MHSTDGDGSLLSTRDAGSILQEASEKEQKKIDVGANRNPYLKKKKKRELLHILKLYSFMI